MNSWQVIMLPYGQYIRNYEKIDVTGPTGAEIILRHKARFKLQILVTPVTRHFSRKMASKMHSLTYSKMAVRLNWHV